ncbi:MAG: 50S ribosomal protein L4 [Luteibaculaceae bacterium]
MELSVLNIKGEDTKRKVTLSADIFGIAPNDHVIYLDVKQYLANQRQGTAKTKERGEISGSTKKIRKQKGSGGARFGSIKSPLLKGGGTVFGPQPRDYSFKLNKKVKRLARKSALAHKATENGITILDSILLEPKTKQYKAMLAALNLAESKTLVVLESADKNVFLSGRNIPKTKVVVVDDLNTYDIMNAKHLIIAEGSLNKLETILNN